MLFAFFTWLYNRRWLIGKIMCLNRCDLIEDQYVSPCPGNPSSNLITKLDSMAKSLFRLLNLVASLCIVWMCDRIKNRNHLQLKKPLQQVLFVVFDPNTIKSRQLLSPLILSGPSVSFKDNERRGTRIYNVREAQSLLQLWLLVQFLFLFFLEKRELICGKR